ncbi:uncharacterized protein BXZ73DRAFT_29522, partial [Epithele typhae]|uniref:uncharacterized protein n=1 Tax=Epithele typhae TaxID=378194 RepID=UPI0020079BD3
FIFYEYLITFGQEVELFWGRKINGASVLFFVNRYVVLTVYLLNTSGFAKMSDNVRPLSICIQHGSCRSHPAHLIVPRDRCSTLARSAVALTLLQYVPWAVFSGLRALALARHWSLGVLVFLLSIMPAAVDFSYFRFGVSGENVPIVGCEGNVD